MNEQNKIGRAPDFKGDGVAVWVNEKDGKKYLSVVVLGQLRLAAFPYERKVQTTKVEEVNLS